MVHFYSRLLFIVGVLIGVFIALSIRIKNVKKEAINLPERPFSYLQYKEWALNTAKIRRKSVLFDEIRYGNRTFHPESEYLYNKVNILCVILVRNEKNLEAAKSTWTKGCNQLRSIKLESGNKTKMPVKRKREDSSWVLLCNFLRNQVPEESDWILIVQDFTFVLPENLRMFVARLNPNDKYYLGHALTFWNTVYNDGGAGYLLSRGSIKTLQNTFKSHNSCMNGLTYWNREDYYLGRSLKALNITPADTRDDYDLSTFHPYNLYHTIFPDGGYHKNSFFPQKCCSKFTITFQGIEGDKMYTYYYLLYRVQLFFSGTKGNRLPSTNPQEDEPWKVFLKSRNIPVNISEEHYYKIWENIVDDPTSFARHMRREEYSEYDPL